jgi:flagellar protein FliS
LQATGYGAYQRIQAETSSPAELIALLYNGLQMDLRRAEQAIGSGDIEVINSRLKRAQEIVLELLASLDHSYGEIPSQLSALYEYMYQRLVHANVHKDADAVREVADLVTPLVEAWSQVVNAAAEGSADTNGSRP